MTTWFTADLHFGHANIIGYCDRPFDDVEAMNRAMIDNWNEIVGFDDTVWVLGDYALGKIDKTLALTSRLRGRKILVAGNHDRCWFGRPKHYEEWTERYLEAGFDEIIQGSTTFKLGSETVDVCHFPYQGDSHDEDRFTEHRPIDTGRWLLHGHVHGTWAQNEHMINVGVDVRGFRPISSENLNELMRTDIEEQATPLHEFNQLDSAASVGR